MKRPGECKLARPARPVKIAGNALCPGLVPAWLLSSFLCLVLLQPVLKAAALSSDGLALLDFKRHAVDESQNLSSWNENDHTPCEWEGVTCGEDGAASSVLSLNLSSSPLGGTLSSSLGALANLTYLDLTNTRLSGPIPPEIVNARLLTVLNLGNNALSGSIPGNVSQLRSLTRLDLSSNSLGGSIPSLNGSSNLIWLDLSNNRLEGRFPSVELLKNLEYVDLSSNNFTGRGIQAPQLADLKGLREIRMSGCRLEGPLPSGIAGMPNLTYIDLSSNRLSGPIPEEAWGNKTLHTVDLSDNWFVGSIPRQLLEQLHGHGGRLNLSNNHLLDSIPDALNVSAVQGLKVDLSHNHLDGPIPSTFGSASLEELHLHDNLLSGDITSVWSSASSSGSALLTLELQGNRLEGVIGPATCKNWANLQHLDLSGNPIRLVNCSLSIMLGTFEHLRELRLSNINSSGKLPGREGYIWHEPRLISLDLSNSSLEGDLAESLLAEAQLFRSLAFLDLSDNALTGQVPSNLTELPDLIVLDLANNRLSGRLPKLQQHLLKATFFAGNADLCGAPLQECRSLWYETLAFKLVAALGACVLVSAAGCLFLVWRLRVYSERHRQDADLIVALQGKDSANLMPLADLRKATSNFAEGSQIGVGGFGTVYKGRLSDGTVVAIKKSKRQKSQQDKDQFLNEVRILSRVNHRNLVRLLGCCLANKTALLVFEYVPNGTLQDHLRARGENAPAKLAWKQRLRIALDTADALAYLHSYANPPIFHRDVKSANILLDEDMNAKVADFGISKLAPLDATHVSTAAVQGTFGYIDPEYYRSFQLSAKSDVYSFGVVLLELISGQAPVDLRRGSEDVGLTGLTSFAVPLIRSGEVQEIIDPAISEAFMSSDSTTVKESIVAVATLAVRCLKSRSKDRPSMKEVSKELQALWLGFDPTPGSRDGDQLLESQVVSSSLGLQVIPEDGFISLPSDTSFPGGSGFATYIQMEDMSSY